MRAALAALPGVRHVIVDFEKKQAVATVEPAAYDNTKFIAALDKAGFGGSVKAVKPAVPVSAEGTEPTASPPKPGLIGEQPEAEPNQTVYSSASFAEHVRVSVHLDRDMLRPGDSFRLAVVFDIEKGWHIYGNPIGPGIGKETVVSVEAPDEFDFDSARYAPAHRLEQDFGEAGKTWVWENTGKTIHYLSGAVRGEAKPGDYQWTVEAFAQVCTATACLPGTATIRLPVTVAPQGSPARPINLELFEAFEVAKTPPTDESGR